jgi:diacylglycerol kinase family enzyme
MTATLPVVVNRSGGTASSKGDVLADELQAAFADAGVAIDLHLVEGNEIRETVRRVLDAHECIVVGGGDGTVGCAAQCVAAKGATLGILPLGTRNHLARELGIPLDLPGAAAVIASGRRRRIDLAEVNSHVFINNASVGIYPEMVRDRDARAAPKWASSIGASIAALARMRHHRLRLAVQDGVTDVVTPMLLVGNNRYTLAAGRIGTRETLEGGQLAIYAVASRRRIALIGFALRTILGLARPSDDFAAIGEAKAVEVSGRSRTVDIALDGEVVELPMPLRFESRAAALCVFAPA